MDSLVDFSKETQVKVQTAESQRKGKQIGIMGGTFNPVHMAHLVAAEQAMTKLHLDEVWFILDNIPPHKDAPLNVSARDRATMLDLATRTIPVSGLSCWNSSEAAFSYTIDTVRYLTKKAPENTYYLIMGSDQVNSFHKWKNAEELAKLATLVGIRRPGYPQDPQYSMIWVDAPDIRLSSTAIRQAVSTGTSIRYLVPDKVREYIEEKGLYRD
ncbi:nicotinate-nucleotide adenylyltransferase [Lactobacillus delbrueckii subsp. lactis DSM 20072]|nr:nicotinate-nucleotide adenylyltransferase [Lactobacillus delbrueckii subsp. lactis DSM 20072]